MLYFPSSSIMNIPDDVFFVGSTMSMQKARMESAIKHASLIPSDEVIFEAMEFVAEQCGVAPSKEQFLAILSLYPEARGKIAYGWGNTEIRDITLDAIAHFFLSTSWPRRGDDVDSLEFVKRLNHVADYMEYAVKQHQPQQPS